MKHGRFAICLLLMVGIAVTAAFGDEQAFVLEAIVMENFEDGEGPYVWRSIPGQDASKFARVVRDEDGKVVEDQSFPKVKLIATAPAALPTSSMSLGINSSFTRRGYNWVDVYPEGPDKDQKGIGFDLPGRVQYLDMWVWGSNLNYTIEAYFRDYQGMIRSVNLGSIAYEGWKNLRVQIPSNFLQTKKVLPNLAPLRFIKFRIWTSPTEIVDQLDPRYPGLLLDPNNPGQYDGNNPGQYIGVFIYFDNLRILTDMFEAPYDGRDLEDIAKTQELWAK